MWAVSFAKWMWCGGFSSGTMVSLLLFLEYLSMAAQGVPRPDTDGQTRSVG
jgi:hypothetical protein